MSDDLIAVGVLLLGAIAIITGCGEEEEISLDGVTIFLSGEFHDMQAPKGCIMLSELELNKLLGTR